jgi:hypothetical protein
MVFMPFVIIFPRLYFLLFFCLDDEDDDEDEDEDEANDEGEYDEGYLMIVR